MFGDDSPGPIDSGTSDVPPREPGTGSQQRPKGGNQGRRGGRPQDGGDDRRKRKPTGGDRRAMTGFGDGIERAFCLALRHLPPPAFPVQHRTGIAALVPTIIARRSESVLLCDCAHEGPHSWPDGEIAGDRDS